MLLDSAKDQWESISHGLLSGNEKQSVLFLAKQLELEMWGTVFSFWQSLAILSTFNGPEVLPHIAVILRSDHVEENHCGQDDVENLKNGFQNNIFFVI